MATNQLKVFLMLLPGAPMRRGGLSVWVRLYICLCVCVCVDVCVVKKHGFCTENRHVACGGLQFIAENKSSRSKTVMPASKAHGPLQKGLAFGALPISDGQDANSAAKSFVLGNAFILVITITEALNDMAIAILQGM